MNILYKFKYRRRFEDILDAITRGTSSVLELCFGDILIASECKKREMQWTGIDLNPTFVNFAIRHGFHAIADDVLSMEKLQPCDVCIMSGSLYHFYADIEKMIAKLCASASCVIISEPVVNLSSGNGMLARLARIFTNAGKGNEDFRFNAVSLIETLYKYKDELKFSYRVISVKRDMLIEIQNERNQRSNTGI